MNYLVQCQLLKNLFKPFGTLLDSSTITRCVTLKFKYAPEISTRVMEDELEVSRNGAPETQIM